MRVVFDTNIFISAFIVPGGQAELAFLAARRRRFDLFTSVAILTETAQTLREKFHQSDEDVREALKLIGRAALVVNPASHITVLKDAPDNRILECAVEAQANVIVTGDHHLLKLRAFEDTAILRLSDFLRLFPDLETR